MKRKRHKLQGSYSPESQSSPDQPIKVYSSVLTRRHKRKWVSHTTQYGVMNIACFSNFIMSRPLNKTSYNKIANKSNMVQCAHNLAWIPYQESRTAHRIIETNIMTEIVILYEPKFDPIGSEHDSIESKTIPWDLNLS